MGERSPDLEKRLNMFFEKNVHLEEILMKFKGIKAGEMENMFLGYWEKLTHTHTHTQRVS